MQRSSGRRRETGRIAERPGSCASVSTCFDVLRASAESLPDVGDIDSGISETEHSALDRTQLAVLDLMI
jgi:hypothetical protein